MVTAERLVTRNVIVAGRRTSMRLELDAWDALEEICQREATTVHELCTMIDARRRRASLTAATRRFMLAYFRAAATNDGHRQAGHGLGHLNPRLEACFGGMRAPENRVLHEPS